MAKDEKPVLSDDDVQFLDDVTGKPMFTNEDEEESEEETGEETRRRNRRRN